MIQNLIPKYLKEILKTKLGVPSQKWSLENLKRNRFEPNKIVDIGAYEGKWTQDVYEIFPNAQFLMIEAQSEKVVHLEKTKLINLKNIDF
ncbi:MAG: hypothetical protein EAZ53_08980 [Bacteroidetes bacterium]|nr:MAG: hypothetical protein EAZ53_08980 [Bacteroidota bacterium]